LRLYSRKILIQQRNKDLLPEYLRFIEGVVDSEDLPLNISREMVQSNPIMRNLKKALTSRVFRELKTMAEQDTDKYAAFWQEFGVFLKEGVASDHSSHESLLDLVRFHSTKAAGEHEWVSFKQYVERMGDDQKAIYYVLGEDRKSVARSPHLDYFRANDIEVLYLTDPIDGFMTTMLREYEGKTLQNVDDAGLELPKAKEDQSDDAKAGDTAKDFDQLLERFKSVLGDRITSLRESKQLVNSPCRLVSPENSFDRDLQRIRRLTEQSYEAPKKMLEVNRNHPLIINLGQMLAQTPDNTLVDTTIEQLFNNALLLDGVYPNPADMVEHIQTLMEAAVAGKAN
jgi:molecular chaperone HtpG